MQAWLLYRLRFSIAPDLAEAWAGFGGLAAQLNHLAIVMNISIADSAAVALSYGRLVRGFLAERARSRHEMTLGDSFFSDFLSVENPDTKLRATAANPRSAPQPQPKNVTKEQPNAKKKNDRSNATQNRYQRPSRRSVEKSANRPRPHSRSKRKARTPPRRASPKRKATKSRRYPISVRGGGNVTDVSLNSAQAQTSLELFSCFIA